MSKRKQVAISGGSRGLGRALALEFSRTHQVFSFSRNDVPKLFENIDHRADIDLTSLKSLREISGPISGSDVLINNAGTHSEGILATQDYEEISRVIDLNLTSTIKLTKLYIRERIKKEEPGIVINISSVVSKSGHSGLAAYSASKAGLDGFTRALAREMGPKGFRINSVLPGYFESEMTQSLSETEKSQILRRTPLGRLATLSDIVAVVRFLSSDEAAFITGQSLVVDGGLTT